MNPENCIFIPESPSHAAMAEALALSVFGPGMYSRTAFRLREGVAHDPALSFVCDCAGALIGSVRLTQILIGAKPALLLGPLVVSVDWKKRGIGRQLTNMAVNAARGNGHGLVILVGDLPYYQQMGFRRVPHGHITLQGPVNPQRLLACELYDGALADYRGTAARQDIAAAVG